MKLPVKSVAAPGVFEVSDGLGKLYNTYSKIFEFIQFQIIIDKKMHT